MKSSIIGFFHSLPVIKLMQSTAKEMDMIEG